MADTTHITHRSAYNMHPKSDSKTSSPIMEREQEIHTNSPTDESGSPSSNDEKINASYPEFSGDLPWSQRSWLYQLLPFRGIYYDFRRRAPFLASDWTTAFYPQNWWTVVQYIPRMYFINLMPAISYIIDMNHRTDGSYGLNEVILASALAAIVFPIFSIQPLTFVGVTGLINLVNYTQFDLVVGYYGLDRIDYLRVQAWSLIWAAGFHFLVSIFNVCDFTRFITDMTSSTFGFYVGIVYIQKGIELLLLEFEPFPLNNATGWLSVTIAILFTVSVYLVTAIGNTSFLPFKMRYFISSFAFAAGCIFWTGFSHFPKNSLERVPIARLPVTRSFFPTLDRSWFIDFWNIEAKWAFVGAPLGFLIMLLFYFDHNVSSVMAQARQFPVKRPAGFHWDFFLLGITTLVSGFLGLPAPNGLVPQCPWSTEALSVYEQVEMPKNDQEEKPLIANKGIKYSRHHIINSRVVENRLGHLIVGLLTLGTMTRPLLVVLGTMPRALFAGIFILVGWSSIEGNPITTRTLAIFKDRHLGSINDGLGSLRRRKIALFVGIQWIFFAMTIAISQTIAAIGFPVIFVLLIPFRYYIVPKWFSPAELRVLDAPTADADVVLASIGQETEAVTGQGQKIARDTGIAGTEWQDESDDEDGGVYNKQRETSLQSEAPGYIIRGEDEEEDDDDQVELEAVRSTDIIAHMSDMGGGVGSIAAEEKVPAIVVPSSSSAGATIQTNDAVTTTSSSSPTKNNKRNKSATQSWWGLGGSKAVERAPSPHKPVTPSTSDAPSYAPVGTTKGEESSGLKRFFSSKRKDERGGLVSEKGTTESPRTESPVAVIDVQQLAVDQHFASHHAAVVGDTASPTGMITTGATPGAALAVNQDSISGPASTGVENSAVEVAAVDAASEKNDKNVLEKAPESDKIETALNGDNDNAAQPGPIGETANDIVPLEGNMLSPQTEEPPVVTNSATQDNHSKGNAEVAAEAGAATAAAATYKITDDYKQKEKDARDAHVAAKKKKEDDKQKAKEDKKKAKQDKEEAKKKEKEDKKKKKEEAALLKKQEKEKAKKSKYDAKEDKLAKQRAEEKAVIDKKHAEDEAAANKKLAEGKAIADKIHADQVEKEEKKKEAAEGHTDKEMGVSALAALAVNAIIPHKHEEGDDQEAKEKVATEEKQHDEEEKEETKQKSADGHTGKEIGLTALTAVAVGAILGKDHQQGEDKSDAELATEGKTAEEKSAVDSSSANPVKEANFVPPVENAAIAAPLTSDKTESEDVIAPVVIPAESQAQAQKDAEEEQAKRLAEEETARKAAEEEQAKKVAEEEAARKAAEEETARKAAEEETARKAAEEKTARKAAEEETARKAAEEETARKAAEEELAKKQAEEEAALVALANEKAALEKELAETQAKKDKELNDLEESKKAKEKEIAETKEKEEAALALLIANQKKTEDEIALRKEKEAKETANKKESDEKEAAARKEEAEKEGKEAAAKKEQAEKEATAKKEKEEADIAKAKQEKLVLEAEIAALEAKALSARSYLAPAKIPKSSLTVLSGQVAGHDESVYTLADDSLVVKTSTISESSFYQNILIHQTAVTQKSQLELLTRLRKYLPTYHGTIELTSADPTEVDKAEMAVILENLTRGYKNANVLDIKLGKQFWDDASSQEKKERMEKAAKSTTSGETGIRLTGWQVWNKEKGAFIKVDKKFGKTVKADQLNLGLRSYFGVSSKEEATKVSEIVGEEIPATTLPEKTIERILRDGILPAIKEIIDVVKKLEWRVRGGSLLIIYEGDESKLKKINAKSYLEAGRSLTDTDQLVDTSNLSNAKVPTSSRLVDVRLIDFAHASFASEKGVDDGYLAGLETIKHLLEDLSKGIKKGNLHASGQRENVLKSSGGADLIGTFTGLYSRDKSSTTQTISDSDKQGSEAAKETKEVTKPDVTNNNETELIEIGGAGAAVALATTAVRNKSTKGKKTDKPKKAKAQPEQNLVSSQKETKAKQGGFMSLFSARLVADDAPKQQASQKQMTTKPVTIAPATPKKETKVKQSSFEIIRTPQAKKEIKEKDVADGSALDSQIPPDVLAKLSVDKGKGKEKEGVDKLASFWQTKETSLINTEGEVAATPAKSTGPRKLIRHENPRRGAGKAPPAIQFRDPE